MSDKTPRGYYALTDAGERYRRSKPNYWFFIGLLALPALTMLVLGIASCITG